MAVDTVRLRSPYISEELAELVEAECTKRLGIDMRTGNVLWEITTGDLKGSYDNRIAVVVKRKEWKADRNAKRQGGKAATVMMDCPPYIEVEASVHKLLLGHNIYGGTEDFVLCCRYLLQTIEQGLGITLPGGYYGDYERHWQVKRIDFSYVFHMEAGMEAIEQFFYLMRNAYYGRRNAETYGLNGLRFNASTTVLKFYHKGPEFRKHDMSRLVRAGVFSQSHAFELLQLATDLLRVEVEIKPRKMRYDFDKTHHGTDPWIKDITPEYLRSVYETEVSRVMKEGKKAGDVVRDALDVEDRLRAMYPSGRAGVLFNAYVRMAQFGIQKYKSAVPKRTFYRHMKELKEAGVSVQLTGEVNLEEVSGIAEPVLPKDFQPLRDDPRRLGDADPEIIKLAADMNKKRATAQKKDFRIRTEAQKDAVNSQTHYSLPF
nr:phage/plasmid replication protein, II/X family [Saccharibacillus qingshengii]